VVQAVLLIQYLVARQTRLAVLAVVQVLVIVRQEEAGTREVVEMEMQREVVAAVLTTQGQIKPIQQVLIMVMDL